MTGVAQSGAEIKEIIEMVDGDIAKLKEDEEKYHAYTDYRRGKIAITLWSLNDLMKEEKPQREKVSYDETRPDFPATMHNDINTLLAKLACPLDRVVQSDSGAHTGEGGDGSAVAPRLDKA
jgi:hypothetical protein